MKLIQFFLLVTVIAVGIFFRVTHITSAPPGMLVDETSIGYNAYSILKTGRDEFGVKHPLSFKAYGEYKMPAYIYASVIPVKVFGLNSFAVRFVSILSGISLIVVVFLLVKQLGFGYSSSLIGALITAVSTWTIILSRYAWESNLGLVIFTSGLLAFFVGINKHKVQYFITAGILFGLTWYCYLPYRVVSTLFILAVTVYIIFKHKSILKQGILLGAIFVITISPLVPTIFSKEGTTRFKQTSIFSDPRIVSRINENRSFCTDHNPKILCYLTSNKVVEYSHNILDRYSD
ncbi:MAG: glycosyltransferase family 39 protein, partial [Patescibacteria group bacterium]